MVGILLALPKILSGAFTILALVRFLGETADKIPTEADVLISTPVGLPYIADGKYVYGENIRTITASLTNYRKDTEILQVRFRSNVFRWTNII